MITITEETVRCCNVCHSNGDDVLTIKFSYMSNPCGTAIMLCENCRRELQKALQEVHQDKE